MDQHHSIDIITLDEIKNEVRLLDWSELGDFEGRSYLDTFQEWKPLGDGNYLREQLPNCP